MRFALGHFAPVLELRNQEGKPYVIIGGQAVNYWAEKEIGASIHRAAIQLREKRLPQWRAKLARYGLLSR